MVASGDAVSVVQPADNTLKQETNHHSIIDISNLYRNYQAYIQKKLIVSIFRLTENHHEQIVQYICTVDFRSE